MQVSEITAFLENAYDVLNRRFFNGELTPVVITVQSSVHSHGHYTPWNSWVKNGEGYREINLSAESLRRNIESVISTLQHESVHHYCDLKGIKDTSRNGTYHNKRFKAEAEKRGLIIDYDPRIGHSITYPGPEIMELVREMGWENIDLSRRRFEEALADDVENPDGADGDGSDADAGGEEPKKRKSGVRKYQCPTCGNSVRATKDVNVGCLDCNCKMELVEQH